MVKNESKHLDKSLQSLVPVLEQINSELIIVDTGSTDNTVKIAGKYTDKVYQHQWNNDFAQMRNKVLSYATGKWFFYLDGDEVLEDANGIIAFFNSNQYKKYNSAYITVRNVLSSNSTDYACTPLLRFFKNDQDFHFKGIIHEQPQAKGPIGRIKGKITHYGYINDDKELMEYKYQRNIALINKVLEEDPENIYHLFQLSQSYSMYGEPKKALKAIQKAYKLAKGKGLAQYMNVVTQLALVYSVNKLYQETEAICIEGINLKAGYIDLYYYKATAQLELGKTEEAIASFQEYLKFVDKYRRNQGVIDLTAPHKTVSKFEHAYRALCAANYKIGQYDTALKYGWMIESELVFKEVLPLLVDTYIKQGQIASIKYLYDKWIHNENMSKLVIQIIENRRIAMDLGERKVLSRVFAGEQSPYGFLHRVRKNYYDQDEKTNQLLEEIQNFDLSKVENFYGDLLFHLIRHKHLLTEVLSPVKDNAIVGFSFYLFKAYKEFQDYLLDYLETFSLLPGVAMDDSDSLRVQVSILHSLLQFGKLKDVEYEKIFKAYIKTGVRYLELSYHPDILGEERVSWMKSNIDAFLLYMRLAEKSDQSGPDYIRNLRLALKQDESMKRGIEILLEEIKSQLKDSAAKELEVHKETIIQNIEDSINSGDIDTAKVLVKEYENIVDIDVELCSAKAIIFIIEKRLDEAKEVLLKGLKLDPLNSDLLYNMEYLNELENKKTELETSCPLSLDEEIKRDKKDYSINPKVTLIIPTYNQKEYLKEAIESGLKQDYPNVEILVGDDCSTDGTEKMMEQFKSNPQVKCIRHSCNLGAGYNTVALLENHVQSKYAMILNHDDYLIKNDYISNAVRLLIENPNLSFVWSNCKIKYEENGRLDETSFDLPKVTPGLEYFLGYETEKFPHITGILTTVFDLDKLKISGFGNEKSFSRDTFLHLKLMLVGDVGFIKEHVAVYRVHRESISFNLPLHFDASTLDEFEALKKLVLDRGLYSNNQMDLWMDRRVYAYIAWRFRTLWNVNKIKDAINLLASIASSYPRAYKSILDNTFK